MTNVILTYDYDIYDSKYLLNCHFELLTKINKVRSTCLSMRCFKHKAKPHLHNLSW